MPQEVTQTPAVGTQRYILIQLPGDANKRRRKRPSKQKYKSKLPLKKRVFHILSTSKILDYTHPKETDPFWDIIYKQYEYLVYMEMYFRMGLAKTTRPLSNEEIIDILQLLEIIKRTKERLLTYMVNGMFVLYGSVMKKKFYGWFEHIEYFISRFNETTMNILTNLKFDVNRTRCSVYFYQAFWLAGLSIKNEILEDLKRFEGDENPLNRGNKKMAVDYEVEFDELFAESSNAVYDLLNERSSMSALNLSAMEPVALDAEQLIEYDCAVKEWNDKKDNDETQRKTRRKQTPDNTEIPDSSYVLKNVDIACKEFEQIDDTEGGKLQSIVEYLLNHLGLTRDAILDESNLPCIIAKLKKKITSNEISLTPQQRRRLIEVGFKL